jgi:hypothetical protein
MKSRLTAAFVVLGAIGFARAAYFHFHVERHLANQRAIDERYRAIFAALPRSGTIGYVSDRRVARTPAEYEVSPGTRRYIEAQYAVAPVILRVDDDRSAIVLADASDRDALHALLDRRKLVAVLDTGGAVALARPKDR